MPETIKCSNAECKASIDAKDKEIGDRLECPRCGTVTQVLAEFDSAFDLSGFDSPDEGHIAHPARQVCTACGTVLGVRAATCPGCGGDVRTGVTHMKITAEEKRKSGLPALLGTKKKGGKGRAPLLSFAIGGVVMLALVAVAVIAIAKLG